MRNRWLPKTLKTAVMLFAGAFATTISTNASERQKQNDARIFEEMRLQLGQLNSLRWVGGNDVFLSTHISEDLRELQKEKDLDKYDQSRLDDKQQSK